MCETCRSAEAASVQLDDPIILPPEDVSKFVDDRELAHAAQIWGSQDLNNYSARGVSTTEQGIRLCNRLLIAVLTTLVELQKLTVQGLPAISEDSVLSARFTTRSDAFQIDKEALLS